MAKKNIFNNKKSISIKIFTFILFFFLIFFFIFIFNNKNYYFTIKEFKDNYYIVPNDKKGKKIPNINKQILNLNRNNDRINLNNNDLIQYSIQFYASIYYDEVKEKLDFFLQKDIFNKNDFSIVVLEHSIGKEYILIYKNFESKNSAYNYCSNYIKIINSCLIVNIQNLD